MDEDYKEHFILVDPILSGFLISFFFNSLRVRHELQSLDDLQV